MDETCAEHDLNHQDNGGKTPFQRISKMMDKVRVVDYENRDDGEIAKRSVAGWHNDLTSKYEGVGSQGQPCVAKIAKADSSYDYDTDPDPFHSVLINLYRSR